MLEGNDVSNDANSNCHANVTGVTQEKAHGCCYMAPLNGTHLQNRVTGLMSNIVLDTGSSDGDDILVCGIFSCEQQH